MSSRKEPRMAYLGMGNMGKAMSRNLATKANLDGPIVLWSRTAANATAHAETEPKFKAVDSLLDAVKNSDIIWSCLADDNAVTSVFDTIIDENLDFSEKLFVDCSTISTETTKAVAAKVLQHGAGFVAMPVFGEPSMAAAGILTLVPAGIPESVEKIRPYLVGVLGRTVIDYSGEPPEKSSLLKLVGNTFIIAMIEALAEGHVLAEKSGLGVGNLEKFIQAVFPAPFMLHSNHMTSGRYHTGSPIANIAMGKHVAAHVLKLAESCGAKLPAYEAARKNMDVVEDTVGPTGDIDGLYGAVRVLSGLPYGNN